MEVVTQKIDFLFSQNRFAEARTMIVQQLATEPQNPALNAYLGYCLRMEDRAAEGLKPASYAVSSAPDWPFVHYVLAHVYEGMEKWKDALAAIDRAITLDPAEPSYHGLKAYLLFKRHKWKDAIASAERGLQFDPEHDQCQNILTAAKNQLGLHGDVEHLVDESLRRDPENAMAFANKGWSCLRQGQPKEAVRHFREALRLEPELEYARLGCLEALKAHNPPYRWLLYYFFKMGSLPGGVQFGIIIGLFVLYRVVRSVGADHPELEPITTPLVVAYLAFAYVTWVGMRLADCALLFHPFGRLAMTKVEKRNAWILGCTLLAGVALLAAGAYTDVDRVFTLGFLLVIVTIPLVGTLNAVTRRAQLIGGGVLAAILGLGLLGLLTPLPTFGIAVLIWIAYIWAIGQYVSRN